jgi:hypothetical protein
MQEINLDDLPASAVSIEVRAEYSNPAIQRVLEKVRSGDSVQFTRNGQPFVRAHLDRVWRQDSTFDGAVILSATFTAVFEPNESE